MKIKKFYNNNFIGVFEVESESELTTTVFRPNHVSLNNIRLNTSQILQKEKIRLRIEFPKNYRPQFLK